MSESEKKVDIKGPNLPLEPIVASDDPEYAEIGAASALYSPSMVTDAIKTAIVLLEGGEAEPVVVIPTTIVSAENVEDWLDPENTVY